MISLNSSKNEPRTVQENEMDTTNTDVLGDIFKKALNEIGTSQALAMTHILETSREHQEFISVCCEQLLDEVNQLDPTKARESITLYEEMMKAAQTSTFAATAKCMEIALKLRQKQLSGRLELINKLIEIKAKSIIYQNVHLDIVIKRNEAVQRADLEMRKFQHVQATLDLQQAATIQQHQLQALLEVNRYEIEIADNAVNKTSQDFEVVNIAPYIKENAIIPGQVVLKKRNLK